MNAFTPLSPGCDQDGISPYTISTISSRINENKEKYHILVEPIPNCKAESEENN